MEMSTYFAFTSDSFSEAGIFAKAGDKANFIACSFHVPTTLMQRIVCAFCWRGFIQSKQERLRRVSVYRPLLMASLEGWESSHRAPRDENSSHGV